MQSVIARAFLTFLAVVAGATVAPSAQAADPLTWVAPAKVDVGAGNTVVVDSVSCPSANLCVAAGSVSNTGTGRVGGAILKTTDPRSPASWEVRVFPVAQLADAEVWCPSDAACYLKGKAWPSGLPASSVSVRAVSTAPAGPLSGWTIESQPATSVICASEAYCIVESHVFSIQPPQNFAATVPAPFSTTYSQLVGPNGSPVSAFDGFGYTCGRAAPVGGAAPCLATRNNAWMFRPSSGTWIGGANPDLAASFGAGSACATTFCVAVPDSGFVNHFDPGTQTWTKTAGRTRLGGGNAAACGEDADGAARCIARAYDFDTSKDGILESAQPRSTTPGEWRVTYGIFGSEARGMACATSRTCVAFSFDGRVSAGIAPQAPAPPSGPAGAGAGTPAPIVPAPGSFTISLSRATYTATANGNALFDMVVDAFAAIGLKGALVQKATRGVGRGAAARTSAPKKPAKPVLTGTGKAGADGRARVVGKLSKSGRTLLRKTGKLRVRLTITATSPSGRVTRKTTDVTIRAAKKKR